MLAKEMSDTRNRGRIIWVFATSRPTCSRSTSSGRAGWTYISRSFRRRHRGAAGAAVRRGKKINVPVGEADLPEMPANITLGGNEIEGVFVRGLRIFELSAEPRRPLRIS